MAKAQTPPVAQEPTPMQPAAEKDRVLELASTLYRDLIYQRGNVVTPARLAEQAIEYAEVFYRVADERKPQSVPIAKAG